MNDWYFYQERGETVGPINVEDLKTRIKDGRIRVFDLIYKDGEEAWRMALEHSVLRGEFKSTTLASLKERPWVCLQKKSDSGDTFVTTGPFSFEQIRESILAGKISYSDYAWKDGFSEWKRIGSLEEFNPRVRSGQTAPIPVQQTSLEVESSSDLLKNVVELKRARPVEPEPPPPEAVTPDFTQTKTKNVLPSLASEGPPPPPTQVRVVSAGKSQQQPVASQPPPLPAPRVSAPPPPSVRIAKGSETQPMNLQTERTGPRQWLAQSTLDWSFVFVLLLALAAVVVLVSRFILPRALPKIANGGAEMVMVDSPPPAARAVEPPPEVPEPPETAEVAKPESASLDESEKKVSAQPETPPPAAPIAKAPAPRPVPLPVAPPSKMPNELKVTVHPVGSNQVKFEIRTDGSPEFPVFVQIVGAPGQVSEGGSFYRFLRYVPTGNARKPLDLSGLRLPQGRFILRVETGDLKKEQKFNLGVTDPQFKAAQARQRKMWAHAIWKERLQLFKLSQTLEKQLGAAPAAKKFSGHGLEALNALKRSNGANYLLFEDWWEMRQILKEAKDGVTTALVGRAQRERERLASFSVWK